MHRYKEFALVIFLWCTVASAQNTDMTILHPGGRLAGMTSAGMAIAGGTDAFDLNPAGLAAARSVTAALGFETSLYRYHLRNVRYEENASGARIFEWQTSQLRLSQAAIILPFSSDLSIGLGFLQKMNPFTENVYRAITWSPLFYQTTQGGLYALTLAAAYPLHKNVSIGLSAYRYMSSIRSRIVGDNHGNDTDKWAQLQHRFEGYSAKMALQALCGCFHLGAALSTPTPLVITVEKEISDDRLYAGYLPDYDDIEWELPWILQLGIALRLSENLTIACDLERQFFEDTDIHLNLFEYSGLPNWNPVTILRSGIEFSVPAWPDVPLRLGYAQLPQQYTATDAEGIRNTILNYEYGRRNIRHLMTAGTNLPFGALRLHCTVGYSIVQSQRSFQTRIYIEDDYTQRDYSLDLQLCYTL